LDEVDKKKKNIKFESNIKIGGADEKSIFNFIYLFLGMWKDWGFALVSRWGLAM
jgi:hypothetical protein